MPRPLALVLAIVGAFAGTVAFAARQPAAPRDTRAEELTIAQRTETQIAGRLTEREAQLGARVRILYKLTRGGLGPLVADAGARADLTRRRALASRMIVRDLEERAALRGELALARGARERLELAAQRAAAGELPRTTKLLAPALGRRVATPPVDRTTRARLVSRGVTYSAQPGAAVTAPAAGEVRYAGPIRGRQRGVVLAMGNGVSVVISGLARVDLERGTRVAAGDSLGNGGAAGITLELYLGDRPVDPALLLAR